MQTQTKQSPTIIVVDQARGCTRYTLHIQATEGFPAAVVSAAVIPDRVLGTYRVVVTAGAPATRIVQTVHELGQSNIADRESALSWAREVVRGAEAFWQECTQP